MISKSRSFLALAAARALARPWAVVASLACVLACGAPEASKRESNPEAGASAPPAESPNTTASKAPEVDAPEDPADGAEDLERRHTVVFADRTSQGYLLLIEPSAMTAAPTRAQLDAWIVEAYPDRADTGEVALMRKLAATEPHATDVATGDLAKIEGDQVVLRDDLANREDLLGLYVELLDRSPSIVDPDALADPIATRALSPEQRESIDQRAKVLLIRGDYRNDDDVRGLRLLQSIVSLVAARADALIHDPDTLETLDAETFRARQLTANASNVAEQIVIIPFPEPDRSVRLVTRGMRRFGAPDIELNGLPRDPGQLQRASDLLAGLARALVDAARVHESGLAVSADDEIVVTRRDVERAHANRSARLPPRCEACSERVAVHLRRRPPRDTDADEHLTVEVVAPRDQSDAGGYDHAAWVRSALLDIFGPTPG